MFAAFHHQQHQQQALLQLHHHAQQPAAKRAQPWQQPDQQQQQSAWEQQEERYRYQLERHYWAQQEAEYQQGLAEYYSARQSHQEQQMRLNQLLYGPFQGSTAGPSASMQHAQQQQASMMPQEQPAAVAAAAASGPDGMDCCGMRLSSPRPPLMVLDNFTSQAAQQLLPAGWKKRVAGGGMQWDAVAAAVGLFNGNGGASRKRRQEAFLEVQAGMGPGPFKRSSFRRDRESSQEAPRP